MWVHGNCCAVHGYYCAVHGYCCAVHGYYCAVHGYCCAVHGYYCAGLRKHKIKIQVDRSRTPIQPQPPSAIHKTHAKVQLLTSFVVNLST